MVDIRPYFKMEEDVLLVEACKLAKENELLENLIDDLYCDIGNEGSGRRYISDKRDKIYKKMQEETVKIKERVRGRQTTR